MYTLDFEYAGERLSDYNMMLCRFESPGTETAASGADLTFCQIRSTGQNNFRLYGSTYESAFTATFQICKNSDLLDEPKDRYLTVNEVSALQRWLCRKEYHKFKIKQEEYEDIYWNATFSTKQILLRGQTVGLEVTMYTDAPYAYMEPVIIEADLTDAGSFDIYDSSDEEGIIYPDITITLEEDGKDIYEDDQLLHPKAFTLKNSMSSRVTLIENCSLGEEIKLSGKCQRIETSSPSHALTLPNDFNYYFPTIQNSYADTRNTFTCNTKCRMTISYSPIRKVGL